MTPTDVTMLEQRVCGFKTKRTARDARVYAERRRAAGELIAPYRCPFCHHWHVGHPLSHRHVKQLARAIRYRSQMAA